MDQTKFRGTVAPKRLRAEQSALSQTSGDARRGVRWRSSPVLSTPPASRSGGWLFLLQVGFLVSYRDKNQSISGSCVPIISYGTPPPAAGCHTLSYPPLKMKLRCAAPVRGTPHSHLVPDHALGSEGPRQPPPHGPTLEKLGRAGVSHARL